MGRGRKRKARGKGSMHPTTNKFWSNIVQSYTLTQQDGVNYNRSGQACKPSTDEEFFKDIDSTSYQAPHHQQETIQDLTDDTSPDIPTVTENVPKPGQETQDKKPDTPTKAQIVLGLNPSSQAKKNELNQPNQKQTDPNKGAVNPTPSKEVQNPPQIKIVTSKPLAAEKEKQPSPSASILPRGQTINSRITRGPFMEFNKKTKQMEPVQPLTPQQFVRPAVQLPKPQQYIPANQPPIPQPYIPPAVAVQAQQYTPAVQPAIQPYIPPQPAIPPQQYIAPSVQPARPQQYIVPVVPNPQPTQPNFNVGNMAPMAFGQQMGGSGDPYANNYPKGIPKTFLMGNKGLNIPEPYADMAAQNIAANNATWQQNQQNPAFAPMQNNPSFVYDSQPVQETAPNPMFVPIGEAVVNDQPYSPSDAYSENVLASSMEEQREGSESPDMLEPGQKRLSAFQRLGPVTQPKKPKLTINLMCNKDQSVREVVDKTEETYVPVHLRDYIINSKDETVMKFLKVWPWEKGIPVRKTVRYRSSKSVMLLEQEQMEESYEKDWLYLQISVQGYPPEWTKEKLLDTIMDSIYGKSFIPLFIDHTPQECKFLVVRCRASLNAFHKMGLVIKVDGQELYLGISQTDLTTNKLDFIPKLVLRKRLSMGYDNEKKLDISNFTTKEDISHFIYYPLNRTNNQADLISLKSTVAWNYLTELNLSHNRITSIDGFNLAEMTPKLQRLDLSYNCIQKVTMLLRCRELFLRSLWLEGNPLCHDYIDPTHYVRVLKMMFPGLNEIDGEPIKRCGEMPSFKKNYCPEDAKALVDKFLEVYFPLLDASDKDRAAIEGMYHEKATMTVTYRFKLRYGGAFRKFSTIFNRSRVIAEGDTDTTDGAVEIARLINKWPPLKHDPFTFTVDVIHHDDSITIVKVAGILKLTAETLAEDEHLLSFTRTFVLHSPDGVEYKITNDMVYWDQPSKEYANTAFQITTVRPKRLSLKMESPPTEELKEKLIELFMQLTELSKSASQRCLEHKEWNIKSALEYFTKLVKLDEIDILTKEIG